jgi:hypothetical protein
VQALERDIRDWTAARNEDPKPFMWTKNAEQILESIARLLKRISGAGHQGKARTETPEIRELSAFKGLVYANRR